LFAIGLLLIANSCASAYLLVEPQHTAYFLLLIASGGFVLLSLTWSISFIVLCWLVWAATMAAIPTRPDWEFLGLWMLIGQMCTVTLMGFTARYVRARSTRRLIILRFREEQHRKDIEKSQRELETALEEVNARRAELEKANADLQRSNRELDQFAQVAAHDLKSPLTTIGGFASILKVQAGDKLTAKGQSMVDKIMTESSRMNDLLEGILLYATGGAAKIDVVPIDLESVFEAVLQSLTREIEASGATIEREPLPVVMADERLLGQLFQNLLSNAIKYRGKATPIIQVTTKRESPGWWRISIEDNGTGFDSAQTEQVFEAFTRLNRNDGPSGTGICLAICRRVVERLGGRIWVESQIDKGSVFHVTLAALPAD